MAEWSNVANLRICEVQASEGSNPFFLRKSTPHVIREVFFWAFFGKNNITVPAELYNS